MSTSRNIKSMSTSRNIKGGIASGLVAGLVFAIAEMVGIAALGRPILTIWRELASTVLGERALDEVRLGLALVVGAIAHFTLSAIYGVIYALFMSRLGEDARRSFASQAILGLGFGGLLYLANHYVVAPLIYPWFPELNPPWQFVFHTVFFGVPLALGLAMQARHEHRRSLPRSA